MQPLSILCCSFRDIDIYTTGFPRGNGQGVTNIFRAVKHCLPGPVRITIDIVFKICAGGGKLRFLKFVRWRIRSCI